LGGGIGRDEYHGGCLPIRNGEEAGDDKYSSRIGMIPISPNQRIQMVIGRYSTSPDRCGHDEIYMISLIALRGLHVGGEWKRRILLE
jgi:hypothetical protein